MPELDLLLALLDEIERNRRKRKLATAAALDVLQGSMRPNRNNQQGNRSNVAGSAYSHSQLSNNSCERPWSGPKAPQGGPATEAFRRRRGAGAGSRRPSAFSNTAKSTDVDRRHKSDASARRDLQHERVLISIGAQPAVVKLVSFASGRTRVGKLLTYQSRQGEIPVEDHNGEVCSGPDWIRSLADTWAEEDGRQPSKDVLRLTVRINAARFDSHEIITQALKNALVGHRFAWHLADQNTDRVQNIELVISAARRRLKDEAKPGRIFDTRKSRASLEQTLKSAFGADTEINVQGFAHGVEGVARYLGQLHKEGRHVVFVNRMDLAGRQGDMVMLSANHSALDEAKTWKRDLRSQERRDVAHIVISARAGTAKEAFVNAVRAMLAREFADHRYLFTCHEDRSHIHVHAAVKMLSENGKRLHPKIDDLRRWRRTIAEEARQRDIPMDAVSRFERANPPAYRMKDIRRVERGEASLATIRRVEAVRNGAVHIPVREEGRRHATSSAMGWARFDDRHLASSVRESSVLDGHLRFYRTGADQGEMPEQVFSTDREHMAHLALQSANPLRFVDLLKEHVLRLAPKREPSGIVISLPSDIARESTAIDATDPDQIRLYQARTAAADTAARHLHAASNDDPAQPSQEKTEMADLEIMTSAFAEMETNLDLIASTLPPERLEAFNGLRSNLKSKQTKIVETQSRIERKRSRIEGHTLVSPVAHAFVNFVPERRGETMLYSYRKGYGRVDEVAFSDHGDRLEITNWRDTKTVLAAFQLGIEKWGAVSVSGSDRYKALSVELAAKHGFRLTNPELQDALAAAREKVAQNVHQTPQIAAVSNGKVAEGTSPIKMQADDRSPNSETVPQTFEKSPPTQHPDKKMVPSRNGIAGAKTEERTRFTLEPDKAQAKEGDRQAVTGTDRDQTLAMGVTEQKIDLSKTQERPERSETAGHQMDSNQKRPVAGQRQKRAIPEEMKKLEPGRRTDAETEIALETVKQKTKALAKRENKEAERSARSGERPFDGGGDDHAYRTKAEASAAQRAAKSLNDHPQRKLPFDPAQSPEIEHQRQTHEAILDEKKAKEQIKADKRSRKPREKP